MCKLGKSGSILHLSNNKLRFDHTYSGTPSWTVKVTTKPITLRFVRE